MNIRANTKDQAKTKLKLVILTFHDRIIFGVITRNYVLDTRYHYRLPKVPIPISGLSKNKAISKKMET